MLLVGYFEDLDSERRIEWRCADCLSLGELLLLHCHESVSDHFWLSSEAAKLMSRSRLPLEVHEAVFAWVLARLAEHGLIKGDRIGVDASTMEAKAALRARATGRCSSVWPRKAASRHPWSMIWSGWVARGRARN